MHFLKYCLLAALLVAAHACKGPDTNFNHERSLVERGAFDEARTNLARYLERVGDDHPTAQMAVELLAEIDSIEAADIAAKSLAANQEAAIKLDSLIDLLLDETRYIDHIRAGSMAKLGEVLSEFERMGDAVITHGDSDQDSIRRKADVLEVALVKAQVKSLPKMREAFVNIMSKELWDKNITCECLGQGCEKVLFVGAVFASNGQISSFEQDLHDSLDRLRFKESRYKWYSLQDEYTYYDDKEKTDKDVVGL